jgi:carboxypeptidase Q
MKKSLSLIVSAIALAFLSSPQAIAQESLDQPAIAKIKTESFQNSKVMDTLSYLTDVYGPRLTGSPALKVASEWAVKRLTEWGIPAARLEPWGTFGRGWSVRKVSVEMMTPQYTSLIAYPKAWTPGTKGAVRGKPIVVKIESKEDFE